MKNEISVPTAALSLPGEGEGQSTPPAVGDSVEFNGTAKVARTDGDKTVLTIETINGEPVTPDAPAEPDMDDAEDEMRRDAVKADGPSVY